MKWKPEYVGPAVLVLFFSLFPITAIRMARGHEGSLRFRRAVVILVLSDFFFLLFGVLATGGYASSSPWAGLVVIGLVLLPLTRVAKGDCRRVSKAEDPEFFARANDG